VTDRPTAPSSGPCASRERKSAAAGGTKKEKGPPQKGMHVSFRGKKGQGSRARRRERTARTEKYTVRQWGAQFISEQMQTEPKRKKSTPRMKKKANHDTLWVSTVEERRLTRDVMTPKKEKARKEGSSSSGQLLATRSCRKIVYRLSVAFPGRDCRVDYQRPAPSTCETWDRTTRSRGMKRINYGKGGPSSECGSSSKGADMCKWNDPGWSGLIAGKRMAPPKKKNPPTPPPPQTLPPPPREAYPPTDRKS